MGTSSRIAVMHGDVVKSVYCHWDGYLKHNGSILQKHYDSAKANNLVALGDLSSLKHEDRGEKNVEFQTDRSFESFIKRVQGNCGEWYYIRRDGVWYVGNVYESDKQFYKKLVPLAEALSK